MPNVHIDNVGNMAVVECEGRFVRSDAAFKLRDAVTAQADARVVVLDLTEMQTIGGGVIGMLVFLQRWAYDHDIRFKLFNPVRSVRAGAGAGDLAGVRGKARLRPAPRPFFLQPMPCRRPFVMARKPPPCYRAAPSRRTSAGSHGE